MTAAQLTAYVSTALTGVAVEMRRAIDAAVEVVKEVCGEPAIGIEVYFPGDHTDPVRDAHVSPEDVFRIDRDRVKGADVLITLAHLPSIGIGQELNMALESLVPVVFLIPEGTRMSRMARGAPSVKAEVVYRDAESMRAGLREALLALRPRLESRKYAFSAFDANVTGAKVRDHRLRRQLSREELAEATGMSPQGVALLEDSPDRHSDPSLTQLRRLAAALGVGVADLV
jgi:DNA-binding XRE family transcriptional regulator